AQGEVGRGRGRLGQGAPAGKRVDNPNSYALAGPSSSVGRRRRGETTPLPPVLAAAPPVGHNTLRVPFALPHGSTDAPAPTAADQRHVYLAWGGAREYLVVALDHDGKERWRADLGPFRSGHGFGPSPVVFEGLVVVANDQDGPSCLAALDRDSGKVRWRVPRK